MSNINVTLLRKTLEHIKAHPEAWDQADWRTVCGTAMCFAGHAATIAGGTWQSNQISYLDAVPEDDADKVGHLPSGRVIHVSARAQRDLGLTDDQAHRLFHGANTLPTLEYIVEDLCASAEWGGDAA